MPIPKSNPSDCNPGPGQTKRKAIRTAVLLLLFALTAYFIYGFIGPYIGDKQVNNFWQKRFSINEFQTDRRVGPDRIRLLNDQKENYYTFLNAIDSAAGNLKLVLHKETCGELSDLSIGALLTAANRGVKIEILVDGKLKAKQKNCFRHLATSPQISIREYAPVSLFKPWTYNSRLKDQFLLADDRLAWFSSAGSSDHDYPSDSENVIKTVETDTATDNAVATDHELETANSFDWNVLIYNSQADSRSSADSVLSELSNYFTALWTAERSRPVQPSEKQLSDSQSTQRSDQEVKSWLSARLNNRALQSALNNYRLETQPVSHISLLKNPVNDLNKEPYIWFQLSQLMGTAKNKVNLCTPYLMLSPDMQKDLEQAVNQSGLNVQVITNAAAASPSFLRAADYTYNRGQILDTGVRLSEYQEENGFRGKALLLDDHLTVLGSYDWTLADTYLNTESVLVIDSPEINESIGEQLAALNQNSLPVKPDGSYLIAAANSGNIAGDSDNIEGVAPLQQNLRQKPLLWGAGLFIQLFRSLL